MPSFAQVSYECIVGSISGQGTSNQPTYSNTYCYPVSTNYGSGINNPFVDWNDGSGYDDYDDDYDDDSYYDLGACTSRRGATRARQCNKQDYCAIKDKLTAMISALPITGSASTVWGFGQVATGYAMNSITAGFRDIEAYYQTGDHYPYYGNLNASIDWQSAAIDWYQYDDQWIGPGDPNARNGGAQMILANYFHSLGAGSGNYVIPANLLPEDPDPSTPCD